MNEEQRKKLPKWAQDYIQKIKCNFETVNNELTTCLGKQPKSNTWWNIDFKEKLYLPDFSRVCFETPSGIMTSHVQYEGDGEVYIDISGDGIIYPVARNVIKVIPKGRW